MTFSTLTAQHRPSTQRSSRQGATVDTILWHHQAGLSDDAVIAAMVNRTRTVSANYTISNEGRITCVVDEEYRAWTSGSTSDGGKGAAWDRRAITVEIENESAAPDWRISSAAIAAAAALRADLRRRYNIINELGHRALWEAYRASYPTFCPGPDTVARIVAAAVGEMPPVAPPAPTPPPARIDYQWGLTKTAALAIQKGLARLGRYSGAQDGIAGPQTVTGLQQWLKDNGHLPADYVVDGVPGRRYGEALQRVARRFGYLGPIDGHPGAFTSIALALWASRLAAPVKRNPVKVEGSGWSWWEPRGALALRIQKALRARGRYAGKLDGVFGPLTRRGIQISLAQSGLHAGDIDGTIERDEAYGVQEYAARFGDYRGPKDGAPREQSWKGFALGLERP